MTRTEIIKSLVLLSEKSDEDYFDAAKAIACLLPKNLAEQLRQLVNGPIWDGDVISKSAREELFFLGLAIRVCCKGEQGYTGATYLAYTVVGGLKV